MNVMDSLIRKISEKKNPTVLGLDTKLDYLPQDFIAKLLPGGVGGLADAAMLIFEYNRALIDALSDIVPAVKVQIAYYELYGLPGMEAFRKTCEYAKAAGMTVIADVKRGDIGPTASAYASAYLGETEAGGLFEAFPVDIITVNPYLGIDGVEPFIEMCRDNGKGIFVLVKTSNPSSGQLQDVVTEDGRTIYQRVADLVSEWGADIIGEEGYSSIGAVVGATYPSQCSELRGRMPHTFFLIPGYGAQGASALDLAGCFKDGRGGLVNASRSLLCAWKSSGSEFALAAREEALRMKAEFEATL